MANEIKEKDSVDEAIEWLKFHKEKDWNEAVKKKEPRKYRQYMNRRGGFNRPLEETGGSGF